MAWRLGFLLDSALKLRGGRERFSQLKQAIHVCSSFSTSNPPPPPQPTLPRLKPRAGWIPPQNKTLGFSLPQKSQKNGTNPPTPPHPPHPHSPHLSPPKPPPQTPPPSPPHLPPRPLGTDPRSSPESSSPSCGPCGTSPASSGFGHGKNTPFWAV